MQNNPNFRSGFVSLVGRPNVGKSTILNWMLKTKVSIVTSMAQTTRNRIEGIYNDDTHQVIFVDTPGIHRAENELGKVMNQLAFTGFSGMDLICYIVDGTKEYSSFDDDILFHLKKVNCPVLLLVNKKDAMKDEEVEAKINEYRQHYDFTSALAVSATCGTNMQKAKELIFSYLPYGPAYYPTDQLMNQTERFMVSECIREKIILLTKQEIPYCSAIQVDSFHAEKEKIVIEATIFVERLGQKKIVIGKNGEMIKKIGTASRVEMEHFFQKRIYLSLYVKVEDGWRSSKTDLKNLGYDAKPYLEN
jgi:GTP-binding protein Era